MRWVVLRCAYRLPAMVFAGALMLAPPTAEAATWWWDTTTTGLWTDGANWSDNATSGGTTGTVPTNNTTADIAVFNQSTVNGNQTVQLNADRSINGVIFDNTGSTLLASDSATARTLTVGSGGLTVASTAGAVTIGEAGNPINVSVGAAQSWTNNSTANGLTLANLLTLGNNLTISGSGGTALSGTLTANASNRILTNNIASGTSLTVATVHLSPTASGQVLRLDGTGNTVFNGVISNGTTAGVAAGGLDIRNTGTTTLAAANTFTGNTAIASVGTVVIGGNAAFGSGSGLVDITGGATLRASADYTAIQNPFQLRGSTAPTFTGSSSIGLTGTLTVNGGNRVLTNTIDSTKALTLGTVNLSNDATGRLLTLNGSGNTVFNGVIANGTTAGVTPGRLTLNSTGTATLAAANTYTGTTTLSAGVVNLNAAETVGVSGPLGNSAADNPGSVVLSGGTLRYSSANQHDYSGRFSTATNQRYNVDTNGQTVTWASALISSGGSLTKVGSGTLVLNGMNTYNGTTTLNAGVISLGSAETAGTSGPLGSATTAGSIVLTGGTLQYSASNNSDYSSRFSTATNQRYNVDTNGRNVTWATALTSSGGSLTKLGSGTLTLQGINTYSGQTTISDGVLALGVNGSFANSISIKVGDAGSTNAMLDLTAKTSTFSLGAVQTLSGGGTVLVAPSQQFVVQGTFSPGNSPGLFTFDGGTTVLSGTTVMEIFGTNRATSASHGIGFYDAVNVVNSGTLQFGGILTLEFSSLFDNNTTFNLFTATGSSLVGNFLDINVSGSFYSGLTWNPTDSGWKSSSTVGGQSLEFNASNGQLVIVPEPASLALLAGIGLGVTGWTALRKRRRAS